ncbi:MAG: DUF1579 domain-containing protein [Planctomycetes bacterium]|nr:DUF1579 domain-containing protein [Planctomycetota bacterium]
MKTRLLLSAAIVLCLLAWGAVPRLGAGDKKDFKDFMEMGKPGQEHKILQSLTGTFDTKVKFWMDPKGQPNESTGVMKRQLIMGGRFLQEMYEGKINDMKFFGLGLLGYDTQKKKYTSVWVDSMSTSMMNTTGAYDADKKTFTFLSEGDDPYSGIKMKNRDVLRIVSDTEQIMEMFRQPSDGKQPEARNMEIRYTRKAKISRD